MTMAAVLEEEERALLVRNSVPSRGRRACPFEQVQWALQVRHEALVRGLKGKHLFRLLAADVLPALISTRPKRDFAAPVRLLLSTGASGSSRGLRQARCLSSARAASRWTTIYQREGRVQGQDTLMWTIVDIFSNERGRFWVCAWSWPCTYVVAYELDLAGAR